MFTSGNICIKKTGKSVCNRWFIPIYMAVNLIIYVM